MVVCQDCAEPEPSDSPSRRTTSGAGCRRASGEWSSGLPAATARWSPRRQRGRQSRLPPGASPG